MEKTLEQLLQVYENALDFYHIKQLRFNLGQLEGDVLAELAQVTLAEREQFKQDVVKLITQIIERVKDQDSVSLDTLIDKYIG